MNLTKYGFNQPLTRRAFVGSAASLLVLPSLQSKEAMDAPKALTVQQVIDIILKNIPVPPIPHTTDTIKTGSPDQIVTGIVTTMFTTIPVIRKAIALKANFIIAHEPTFYNHLDETSWLENDKVWKFKTDLLKRNGIAVWRFHDYWHSLEPDGVLMGVLTALGWEKYYTTTAPSIITIPTSSLQDVVKRCKEKLGIKNLRVIGDLSQSCTRIGLIPGASGGRGQMQLLQNESPDVLLIGESPEWETIEYMRDAQEAKTKQALIVLGHSVSEEPGMEYLVSWLQPKVPGITVTHVKSQDPFQWL